MIVVGDGSAKPAVKLDRERVLFPNKPDNTLSTGIFATLADFLHKGRAGARSTRFRPHEKADDVLRLVDFPDARVECHVANGNPATFGKAGCANGIGSQGQIDKIVDLLLVE